MNWTYYIEGQKVVVEEYFIINMVIKVQQKTYVKFRKIIYLEDFLQFLGHQMEVINLQMVTFHLI